MMSCHLEGAGALAQRFVEMAKLLSQGSFCDNQLARGGRKAHELDTHAHCMARMMRRPHSHGREESSYTNLV